MEHLRPDSISILSDKRCRESLSRYFDIVLDKRISRFKLLRNFPVDFIDLEVSEMWKVHSVALNDFKEYINKIDDKGECQERSLVQNNLLDLKIALSKKILESCAFCTHACSLNRLKGEKGYCGCSSDLLVSSTFDHYGEEPELVPSFTVFTIGCTMRCLHCQNWSISQWYEPGTIMNMEEIARETDLARARGCRNLNMVGGDPTPYLSLWLQISKLIKENMPLVWNSNSYYSVSAANLLAEWADLYLLDFKYGNNDCASRVSDAPNYWEICTRNHLTAKNHGELIIRILVLPNHIDCCFKPIVDWIVKNIGKNIRVNIMWQYTPHWRCNELPELTRRLNRNEMEQTIRIVKEAGLENFIT